MSAGFLFCLTFAQSAGGRAQYGRKAAKLGIVALPTSMYGLLLENAHEILRRQGKGSKIGGEMGAECGIAVMGSKSTPAYS